MSNSDRAVLVRNLVEQEKQGVLSTLSRKYAGWPFGSITPYAISAAGDPLIFVSSLAEHTRNLLNDPRVSLFIQDTSTQANPQANARATLLALAKPVPEAEQADAAQRYLTRFPEAQQNFQLGDFLLVKIEVQHVRYIGGFGEMFWQELKT
ncbi:MAG: pyridoxamine 5'-phosphate oxidase family protein [Acidobacteria bacterium]|nr:pyridoxamine 5'-phosphate oxidase family protein [Acidobacteriota bacterium]